MRLEALSKDNLHAFRGLLGSSDFGGCFCAVWTSYNEDWEKRCNDKTQPNFFATAKDLSNGRRVGYLAYEDTKLVGWSGSGPKTSFPMLETKLGSRLSAFSKKTWSIGCLAVAAEFRGRGVADSIIAAVIEKAKLEGAEMVEAYPVRPFHEPRLYRGTVGLFQRAGFTEKNSEADGDHEILLMQKNIKS